MKKIYILLFFIITTISLGQTSVNDYKYAIVSSRFAFQSKNDEYRLNSLTKMFLEQYGFTAFLDTDEMPEELVNNNCNKLFVDVVSTGNFIKTKLKITLKDCKKNILYTTNEGTSRKKEFDKSYNFALREALQSFKILNYKYNPKTVSEEKSTKKEVVLIKENFNAEIAVLFAQPIENGFQLVDNSPKVIMKIFKTSNENCFIATKENINGILISKENLWFFEYYENKKLISESINVKF
jgi:hypothetical protein